MDEGEQAFAAVFGLASFQVCAFGILGRPFIGWGEVGGLGEEELDAVVEAEGMELAAGETGTLAATGRVANGEVGGADGGGAVGIAEVFLDEVAVAGDGVVLTADGAGAAGAAVEGAEAVRDGLEQVVV